MQTGHPAHWVYATNAQPRAQGLISSAQAAAAARSALRYGRLDALAWLHERGWLEAAVEAAGGARCPAFGHYVIQV
jgi:hypothetical protein